MTEEIQVIKCHICGSIGDSRKGIVIKNCYICCNCERKIVNCHCDSHAYDFYVNGLKKIWRCI